MTNVQIKAQKAVIDERWLDRIGTSFRFDHAKGLAEWLKNSIDAYIREDFPDDRQLVYLRFLSKTRETPVAFQCIDFVGMTHKDIVDAFRRWGDPDAASRGTKKETYGGHGNGGKFYMRQMFSTSRFVTYRGGRLNVFGFNEKKQYGFAKGFEDVPMPPRKALELAEISRFDFSDVIRKRFSEGDVRFTLVIGEGPKKMRGRNTISYILSRLAIHPQSRKIIERKPILASIDDTDPRRLKPDKIRPHLGFEQPFEFTIPDKLVIGSTEIEMTSTFYGGGKLTIRSSEEPFARHGEKSLLNCVDILAGIGCVASYRVNELGPFKFQPETEFLYGECTCPILEDPDEDSVSNDREKLVDNDRTRALLDWIRVKIDEVAEKMAAKSRSEKSDYDLKQSSLFNQFLNGWKNKFMVKLYAEIFAGPGSGPGVGGTGGGGSPAGGKGKGDRGRAGEGEGGGGEGEEKSRAARFPRVLLSNKDPDPLNPSQKVDCNARHPPVYQRLDDVSEGIYWINTQAPFAEKILAQYGADSPRWREYLFQRYVDIITKQAVFEKAKKEPQLTPYSVDLLLDDIGRRVYSAAAEELYDFLFQEQLSSGSNVTSQAESG